MSLGWLDILLVPPWKAKSVVWEEGGLSNLQHMVDGFMEVSSFV